MLPEKDPNKGGTKIDRTISDKYCGFCYQGGKFTDEGITMEEKINKNVQIATILMGIPESVARQTAESIIPFLDRWK